MKKVILSFLLVLCFLQITVGTQLAQSATSSAEKAVPTPSPTTSLVKILTPTPLSNATLTPSRSIDNTPTPTISSLATISSTPTPTPTNTPKKYVVAAVNPPKPPSTPVDTLVSFITFPLALSFNYLPTNFYEDNYLSPLATRGFLFVALFCISSGSFLLAYPRLKFQYKRLISVFHKEEKSFPYLVR